MVWKHGMARHLDSHPIGNSILTWKSANRRKGALSATKSMDSKQTSNAEQSPGSAGAHGSTTAPKKLNLKDRPGVIAVSEMRRHFERMVADTPHFQNRTPLRVMEINGQFSHYMDANTDTMWLGFALGMRCAERLSNADISHSARQKERDHE